MKIVISAAALFLLAGALFAPEAHGQNTTPAPPGTTLNPNPNSYNLDLASLDESFHTVSGSNPGAAFYNDSGTNSSASAMVSETSIVENFSLYPHTAFGTVTSPAVTADTTWVQRWVWAGANPPAYQAIYSGSLGASIHIDGPNGNASFSGTFSYTGTDGDSGSHSDSISLSGTGTAITSHVASDALWHDEGIGTVSATVKLHGEMGAASVADSIGIVGPAVNNGNLSMIAGAALFYPAAQIGPQIALDW